MTQRHETVAEQPAEPDREKHGGLAETLGGRPHPHFMNKKRIAKEWLYFLGCFLFGLLVLPFLIFIVAGFFVHSDVTLSEFLSEFYSGLVKKPYTLITWLVVSGPYLLFQLVRSVIWAYKTARNP